MEMGVPLKAIEAIALAWARAIALKTNSFHCYLKCDSNGSYWFSKQWLPLLWRHKAMEAIALAERLRKVFPPAVAVGKQRTPDFVSPTARLQAGSVSPGRY